MNEHPTITILYDCSNPVESQAMEDNKKPPVSYEL